MEADGYIFNVRKCLHEGDIPTEPQDSKYLSQYLFKIFFFALMRYFQDMSQSGMGTMRSVYHAHSEKDFRICSCRTPSSVSSRLRS